MAIHAALCRDHGYRGSYSAVPAAPLRGVARQHSARGDRVAAFPSGRGRAGRFRRRSGAIRSRTRRAAPHLGVRDDAVFFSRHQYVEFVFDQTVMTWLGCHRRAFEWFAAVSRSRDHRQPQVRDPRARVYAGPGRAASLRGVRRRIRLQRSIRVRRRIRQKKVSSSRESNTSREISCLLALSGIWRI